MQNKKIVSATLVATVMMGTFSSMSTPIVYAMDNTPYVVSAPEHTDIQVVTVDGKLRLIKNEHRLVLVEDRMIEWPANMPDPTPKEIKAIKQEKGKFGAAIKAIRKGYSKVPPAVKEYINAYIGLDAILGTLDQWTGAIEDGIYKACKDSGMPDWMAWTVAKALTMIAL